MNDSPQCVDLPIADAARRLGVSERTVYRMVRSGKLQRVKLSDMSVKGVGVRLPHSLPPSTFHTDSPSFCGESELNLPNPVSDKIDLDALTCLTSELNKKDDQIVELLKQQAHMLALIEQLQGQMFELTQALLRHQRQDGQQSLVGPKSEREQTLRNIGWFPWRIAKK